MRINLRSDAVTILLALLPWPLVGVALYGLHNIWAAFALYHGFCLTSWALLRPPIATPAVCWNRRHWSWLGLSAMAVMAITCLAAGPFGALIDPARVESRLRQLQVAPGIAGELPLCVYFAVVNPIAEELFWRATIYGRLRASGRSPRSSATISGVLFGLWHVVPIGLLLGLTVAIPTVLGIALLGVFLALFYERVQITTPLIAMHALGADVPVLLVAWIDVLAKR